MSPIVSEQSQFVIGVDTHAASHTLAVLAAGTGAVLDNDTFPSTAAGLAAHPKRGCRSAALTIGESMSG